ncbi:MAG: filamentous hemagglutinin N-terminal domain-containing protein [Methylococcales bacterium]|nr:filamentous hemagglutinin N-terminal domain-containing protein [Methylococcales bacterium]
MKKSLFFLPLAVLLCPTVIHAEAITDGSVGAIKSLSGNFEVPASLGTTSGTNLFHSFQTFNINSGESATFTGAGNITNVISRVTGGKISTIDGVLRSQVGKADFYFINPAGVVFGKDAKLDVPASFYASTENSLRFKDGVNYSAADLKNNTLSISMPEQFGMLDANAQNNSLLGIDSAKLSVNEKQTLGLASGNIQISDNAQLNAPDGNIIIAANNEAIITDSLVNADGNGQGKIAVSTKELTMENSIVTASNVGAVDMKAGEGVEITTANLDLFNHSQIRSTSYDAGAGGDVNINASGNIDVKSGSVISAHSLANGKGGVVNINAVSLNLDGKNQSDTDFTGIATNANPNSTAQAGQVNVQVDSLTIENGAQMNSSTFGEGDANSVTVMAKNITIDGKGSAFATGIGSNANPNSNGNAGNIAITSDNVNLSNGGTINSVTFSTGDAGSIQVDAKTVAIDGQNNKTKVTGISSDTAGSTGNAGQVVLNAKQLTINNTGTISSSTMGSGLGGTVQVKSDNVDINGKGSEDNLLTGIFSNAYGTGNAGNVSVNADLLTLTEKGRITSNTIGQGQGGEVNVQANKLAIDGNNNGVFTGVASNTVGKGDGGAIKINASDINIENAGRITTNTRSQGKAGSIVVKADNINIDAKNSLYLAGIAAAASPESTGQIGNVEVSATNKLVLKNDAVISVKNRANIEHPESIVAGTISIKAGDVYLQNNSSISAESTGNIDASNIRAQILRGLWMNNSSITMQAQSGNGGAISMNSGAVIDMFSSVITTSVESSTGNGGNITVSTQNLVLDDGAVQANAYSGNGGDVLLQIDSLVGSRNQVQQGGKKIDIGTDAKQTIWKTSSNVRNVIQAASEFGLSGQVTVTSPQINLSGVLAGLSTEQFDPNILRQDYCAIGTGSSLTNKGYGALPVKPSDLLY